jgi:hypothetical protein
MGLRALDQFPAPKMRERDLDCTLGKPRAIGDVRKTERNLPRSHLTALRG